MRFAPPQPRSRAHRHAEMSHPYPHKNHKSTKALKHPRRPVFVFDARCPAILHPLSSNPTTRGAQKVKKSKSLAILTTHVAKLLPHLHSRLKGRRRSDQTSERPEARGRQPPGQLSHPGSRTAIRFMSYESGIGPRCWSAMRALRLQIKISQFAKQNLVPHVLLLDDRRPANSPPPRSLALPPRACCPARIRCPRFDVRRSMFGVRLAPLTLRHPPPSTPSSWRPPPSHMASSPSQPLPNMSLEFRQPPEKQARRGFVWQNTAVPNADAAVRAARLRPSALRGRFPRPQRAKNS
jgi:hypothetical protein